MKIFIGFIFCLLTVLAIMGYFKFNQAINEIDWIWREIKKYLEKKDD